MGVLFEFSIIVTAVGIPTGLNSYFGTLILPDSISDFQMYCFGILL